MANITLADGEFAIHARALAANAADYVAFAADHQRVEVSHLSGSVPIYFSVNGSAAVVAGRSCYAVQPGQALSVDVPTSGGTVVSLISAGAVTYSVVGD